MWASTTGSGIITSASNSARTIYGGPSDEIYKYSLTTLVDETMSATVAPIWQDFIQ